MKKWFKAQRGIGGIQLVILIVVGAVLLILLGVIKI
jgi:hypothetical protein